MRDTNYSTEIVTASLPLPPDEEARLERIFVKKYQEDEIRFSW